MNEDNFGIFIRGGTKMNKKFLVLVIVLPILIAAQTDQKKDVWEPLKFLEGTWEGGEPGVSKVTQVYRFVLNRKFLEMNTKSVFEPSAERPEGEIHEDFGIFSYDQFRKTFVLRGFYVEGFVNQYVLEDISEDGKTFIFLTEHVENAPSGTKAKLIFKIISKDEMEQSFHVAWPGKEFNCFFVHKLMRK